MPSIQVLARRDSSSAGLNPVYAAGIVVIGVIVLGISVWMGIRVYRKRTQSKREEKLGGAFLSVRGLTKDNGSMQEEKFDISRSPSGSGRGFSRNQMTPSIVLPNKAVMSPLGAPSRDEIINFHRQSGTFPKPFSFALARGSPGSSPTSSTFEPTPPSPIGDRSSWVRHSFLSVSGSSTPSRFSVISSTSSFDPNPTTGTARKVRQFFNPVLPDELLLTRLGEQLTLVQSFDDGWCVVGRENASMVHSAKSLFKTSPVPENNVELGVVPAWCFLKPVKGLKAERPVRSTSLGITVQMDGPAFSSRNELVSWSNF